MGGFHLLYQDVYSFGNADFNSFTSFIFGFLSVLFIIIVFIYILTVIGLWKMFKKAGKNGWEAIIPVYNTYTLCKITGVNPWWIVITFVAGIITSFVSALSILETIVTVYFDILLAVGIARSFGKNDGYAVGIYFFGFIFYLILGFGHSNYLGPRPMKDIIFNDNNNSNPSNNDPGYQANVSNTSTDNAVHFCSNCGTPVNQYHRFCPQCGKEL